MSISLPAMYRPDRLDRAIRRTICAAIGLIVLAGCVPQAAPLVTPDTRPALSAPALSLLGYSRRLNQTTPSGREAAVKAARRQVKDTPGAIPYAYLAIALGTPHQHLYTPDEAARYAQRALDSKPAPWDPDARQFLAECVRLYTALAANVEAEKHTAELQSRLDKTRKKLKALSNIENHLDKVENSP